jgi:hypothetical protein
MIQWIKNYLSDIKTTWMLVRYKRRNSYDYLRDQDLRLQHRSQMWQQERINDSGLSDTHISYRDGSGELFQFQDQGDDESEYSSGNVGYKIRKKVNAGGKSVGIYTQWDLFYIGMKDINEQIYNNFIYLSTDGISKHDWSAEIIGVDLI